VTFVRSCSGARGVLPALARKKAEKKKKGNGENKEQLKRNA